MVTQFAIQIGGRVEIRRAQPYAESFRHAPFRYVQRVPSSAIAHVSASPLSSRTVGFPESGWQQWHFPETLPVQTET